MPDGLVLMPLAQLNATSGGAGTAPAVESGRGATVGAPAVTGAGGAGAGVATTSGAVAPSTAPAAPPSPLGGLGSLLPIILMFVALYFFMFRGQRKDEKRRKALISELKKGDKVMTIGGMIAKVVSIDGEEVVLKVDESANVKATYRKSAIQEVLGAEDKK